MNHFFKYLLLAAIVAAATVATAQLHYKKGFIITNSQDTIRGKINDGGGYRNTKVCLFKENNQDKATKYYPGDIKAYRMEGDKYYRSKLITRKKNKKNVFVEVLIDGKANLYHYLKGKKTSFYIEMNENEQMIGLTNVKISEFNRPLPDTPVSYSKDYYLTNRAYLDTLSSLFRDDRRIHTEIRTIKYYRRPLMRITKRYIRDVCKGKDCLTYEKDLNKYKPTVGFFSGVHVSQVRWIPTDLQNKEVPSQSVISNPLGAFVNIPLPKINDRLSLQLEVIDRQIHSMMDISMDGYVAKLNLDSKAFSVPLSFKYEIPGKRLSSSISIGKETNFIFLDHWLRRELHGGSGWFAEMGCDFRIYKKLSVFAHLRAESMIHYLRTDRDYLFHYDGTRDYLLPHMSKMASAKNNFGTLYFGIRF